MERFHCQEVLQPVRGGEFVAVDDGGEARGPMVAGEHGALPNGAFMTFTVPEEDEDLIGSAVELATQCDATTERKAMPKRAGEDIDARVLFSACPPSRLPLRQKVSSLVGRKKTEVGQHRIERQGGLALLE